MTPYTTERLRWMHDAMDVSIHVLADDEVTGAVVMIVHRDVGTIAALAARGQPAWETTLIPARPVPHE